MGRVKESLSVMENMVKMNTPQSLQENLLLNLSTIYELENSDGHKKNQLLKLISEYKGDGINLACLKMPNLITWSNQEKSIYIILYKTTDNWNSIFVLFAIFKTKIHWLCTFNSSLQWYIFDSHEWNLSSIYTISHQKTTWKY